MVVSKIMSVIKNLVLNKEPLNFLTHASEH